MHRNYICSLIAVLPNFNASGEVVSCNRFLFENDESFHTILRCAPPHIKDVLMNLKNSNLLHLYDLSDHSLEDFKRVAGYDSTEFEVDAYVTPEQFIQFLIDNPLYGIWAKKELRNFNE